MDIGAAARRVARARRAVRLLPVPPPVRRAAPHPVVVTRWLHVARQRRVALRLPPLARARRRLHVTPRPRPKLRLDQPGGRATTTSLGGMTRHRRRRPEPPPACP